MRALLLLPLLFVACSQTVPVGEGEPKSLDDAQALWSEADLNDYRMTLTRSCFCPPEFTGPYEVAVEDSRAVFPGYRAA